MTSRTAWVACGLIAFGAMVRPRAFAAAGASATSMQGGPPASLVVLGTGTPNADPERSGPSLAVVVNGVPYLVDAGPGVVRRAAAAERAGVAALAPSKLATVFLTHLHS